MAKVDGTQSITVYCAKSMLPNLEALKDNAQNILKRKNEEDIHDLRVATRRTRTVLDIFQDQLPSKKTKSWIKGIQNITKSFSTIRDLDVQISTLEEIYKTIEDPKIRKGLSRVRLRLIQNRKKKQAKTQNLTNTILESTIVLEMLAWAEVALEYRSTEKFFPSQELFHLAYKKIQSRLDELLFFEVFIFDPGRVEELHQMRISAKRLRYALEVFSDLYEMKTDFALNITRKAQEYLGSIHDADVWIEFLPKFAIEEQERIHEFYGYNSPHMRIKPGIDYLLKNRNLVRGKLYKDFINDWKTWKLKETWLNLRKVIFLSSLESQGSIADSNTENAEEPDNT
jgi:CHAD domain-containing protein